jgi:phage I-like protein
MPRRHATALIAALSVSLTAGAAPSEIRLLPVGRFAASDGSGRPEGVPAGWLLDEAGAVALMAQAALRASDFVIDFEHQTLHKEANGQPAPAAGWFKQLQFRPGDGLYATDVRWTPRAAAMIAAGEYRYLSPVFHYAPDGTVLALGPAALTNTPGLDGLTDLSRAALSALFSQEESPMKDLLKALGLPETATEAEALAALTDLKASHTAALTAVTPDPAKYAPIATLTAAQGELATANAKLAALTAERQTAEVDAVVVEALTAGKLTPATKEWATGLGKSDLAALKAFIAAAPVVVKPGEIQSGGQGGAGNGTAALNADQMKVCAQMAISPDDFAKQLAADAAAA